MAAANVVVTLDFYGLNTALPTIGHDLGGDTTTLQWVANAYLLAMAAPLVAAGRLGDVIGRRRVCTIGLTIFAVASGLAAAVQQPGTLIATRALAGLGAALITATALAIVNEAFPSAGRAYAIGVWSAVGAVGSAIGPLVGGLVTELLSWRWFFALQVPVVAVTAVMTVLWVRESRDETAPRSLDVLGTIAICGGLAGVVFGLVEGPDQGWTNPVVLTSLVLGGLLLSSFVWIEHRATVPLVRIELFKHGAFVAPAVVAFVANFSFAVAMLYLTLYLQQVHDLSPLRTGLAFLAMTVPLAVLSPFVGRAVSRVGPAALMSFGCLVLVGSFYAFGLITLTTGTLLALLGLVLSGIGQAFAFNVSNIAALAAVPDAQVGVASGMISGIRQVGSLVGLAAAAAVFNQFDDPTLEGLAGQSSFVDALRPTMLVVAAVCVVGVVAAWWARAPRSAGQKEVPPRRDVPLGA